MKRLNDQTGMALILEVVLVVVVLGVVGAAVIGSVQIRKSPLSVTPTRTPRPLVSAGPTPSPGDMITFSSSSLSFAYPSAWQLVQVGDIENIYNAADPYIKNSTNNVPIVSVESSADTDNASIDAYLARTYPGSSIRVTSKVQEQVGGKVAYRVTNSISQVAVYVFAHGKRFEFDNHETDNAEDSQVFERLLASVQFK